MPSFESVDQPTLPSQADGRLQELPGQSEGKFGASGRDGFLPGFQIKIHGLDPTLADVRIEFEQVPPGVEIRGRLMGPRCPGVSTVEVAYPLRAVGSAPAPTYQILIPEPSLWKPESPFIYEGPLEFWQEGKMLARKMLSLGLRSDSRLIS